jgi:hypothetical protein
MNLGNDGRGAQTLQSYLYTHPNELDELLLDALGAMPFQTGDNNTASRGSDEARKFFSVYTTMAALCSTCASGTACIGMN